jgi:hypothetical protein
MGRRHVETEHLDEPGQAGCLTLRKLEHESRQRGRVDDRVLKRAFQASTHKPRIERVMAVLDEHGALRETQERATSISKLRRADEHRPVDVVPAVRVRVDRRLAVNQRVEEGERTVEPEALGADLQDEEGRVPGGLDIQRDELRLFERRLRCDLGGVDRDLLPGNELHGTARFKEDWLPPPRWTHRACASARRAQPISSLVNARSSTTATP